MAFENVFRGIDWQAQERAANAQQDRLQQAIGQGMAMYERKQDRDLKERQMEAKAGELNLQKGAEGALFKMAQGIEVSPQEAAMVQAYSVAKGSQTYIDPLTNQQVTKPALQDRADSAFGRAMGGQQAQGVIPQVTQDQLTAQQPITDTRQIPQTPSDFIDVTKVEPVLGNAPQYSAGDKYGARGKVKELDVNADIFKEELRDIRSQGNLQKYNDGQLKAATFAGRMSMSNEIFDELGDNAHEGMTGAAGIAAKFFTAMPLGDTGTSFGDGLVKVGADEDQQRYMNSAKNWVTANLRKESGAVIGIEEMANEYAKYFPMPLDKPSTMADKKRLRKAAEKGMIGQSAGSYQLIYGKKANTGKDLKVNYKEMYGF